MSLGNGNNAENLFNEGTAYLNGLGVDRDSKKACDLFHKSAVMNFSMAQFNLAECYRTGSGREENLDKAAFWYTEAINNGNIRARISLAGIRLYKADLVEGDVKHIIELLVKVSPDTDEAPYALFMLGELYLKGRGVNKDLAKALNYLREAAEKNHIIAQALLYHVFDDGLLGVSSSDTEAKRWAEYFDANPQKPEKWTLTYAIAGLYKNGWGVDKNLGKHEYYMAIWQSQDEGK